MWAVMSLVVVLSGVLVYLNSYSNTLDEQLQKLEGSFSGKYIQNKY